MDYLSPVKGIFMIETIEMSKNYVVYISKR